jgi:hypothetical protein
MMKRLEKLELAQDGIDLIDAWFSSALGADGAVWMLDAIQSWYVSVPVHAD